MEECGLDKNESTEDRAQHWFKIEWILQKVLDFSLNIRAPQYGHSKSELKWGFGDKYYRSINVHAEEAQNLHQWKSPLSDLTS